MMKASLMAIVLLLLAGCAGQHQAPQTAQGCAIPSTHSYLVEGFGGEEERQLIVTEKTAACMHAPSAGQDDALAMHHH